MKLNEIFDSDYLKAEDLDGHDLPVTITGYKVEKFEQGDKVDSKPVLKFAELNKSLACNRTNAKTIANIYGMDLDQWIGKRITLFATEVEYRGDMVMAIRVRLRPPPAASPETASTADGAKRVAWAAFKSRNPGKTDDELRDLLTGIIAQVFPGVKPAQLSAGQWKQLERSGFAVLPADLASPEPIEDIPF